MILSRPTQPWLPLAAAAAAAAVGLASAVQPLAAPAALLVLAMALLLALPAATVPVLVAAAALNRYGYNWGDSNIRVDIVAALVLAVILANRIAVRTRSWRSLQSPLLLPLVLYFAANLFSSLVFAHERVRGLKLDAEIFAVVITYVVLIAYLQRKHDLEIAVKAIWVVTVAQAVLGVAEMAAYFAHVSTFGVVPGTVTDPPMVWGTQWEPNIYGSFLLGNFFILLADYVGGRRAALYTAGLLVTVIGMVLSMTRTVWLGLILGTILFLVLASHTRRARTNILPLLAAVPIVALAGLIVGSATPFAGRLLAIVSLQSTSAAGRLTIFQVALAEWRTHPIFGLGTGSYDVGAVPGLGHPWLPDLFILTLHDTGVVGFAILLLLIFVFYRETLQALHPGGDLSLLIAGCITGFSGLLLAFQSTTGFWFAYPWVVAAVGMAAARLNRAVP